MLQRAIRYAHICAKGFAVPSEGTACEPFALFDVLDGTDTRDCVPHLSNPMFAFSTTWYVIMGVVLDHSCVPPC